MFRTSLTGQFELTPHCNLNCKICYIHDSSEAGRKTLPASFWIEQAKQAVEEGMLILSLTGGETLLYPELDKLMDALSAMGLLISFNTNGTLIDENKVGWFLKYCPNKINISLYGASDQTYEKFCGLKDGFTRVSKAIDLLQAAGLNVYLNGMITPDNIKELPAMHQFARERKLILHESSYAFPLRTGPGMHIRDHSRFSPEQAGAATIFNHMILHGRRALQMIGASQLAEIDRCRQGLIKPDCQDCKGGSCNFQISYEGKMHACAMYPGISIPLDNNSFAQAWASIQKQMKEVSLPQACLSCARKSLCPVCKAAVYLETGKTDQAPAYLCRYSEALEELLRRECAHVSGTLQYRGNLNHHNCSE